MNVGIITFNRAINYGAVLQSYALKNKILAAGNNCEVLNYYCEAVEKGASPFYINSCSPKDILIFLMQIGMRIKKNKKFKEFAQKYLDVSDNVLNNDNISSYAEKFDLLITGSDQVWNYEITDMDENYFLSFAKGKTKTASYAASFGVSTIPEKYRDKYTKLLANVQNISVREETGQKIVEELTGERPVITIDPVFLLKKAEWEEIISPPDMKEEYVLVYSINKTDCYKIAEQIAKEKNLSIVGLQTPMSNRVKCKTIRTESPQEFLGWINKARYVVTDSFHGTAFSIIFNKQFVLCKGGEGTNRLSRQETLLNTTGLSHRICGLKDYKLIYDEIEYNHVNDVITSVRENSTEFLNNLMNNQAT